MQYIIFDIMKFHNSCHINIYFLKTDLFSHYQEN